MGDLYLRVIVGLVGAAAVVWNVVWLWRNRRLLFGAARVEGTVERIDVQDDRSRGAGVGCRYVVTYPVGGRLFEAPAPPKESAVGDTVPVRYLPESPSVALVGWLSVRLFGPLFFLAWGAALLWWAVVVGLAPAPNGGL